MFRVLSALAGSGSSKSSGPYGEERTRFILQQAHDFEIALKAMDYVLDDRANIGLKLISDNSKQTTGDLTVGVLAKGVIEFLEATLGFEPEVMKKAATTLGEAEQLSLKSRAKLQKLNIKTSSIYEPGTEYAVTYTEACLLHALLMLFSESVVEGAKALFKLRKAYHMLQNILSDIKAGEKKRKSSIYAQEITNSATSFTSDESSFTLYDIPYKLTPVEQENKSLLDFANKVYSLRKKRLSGAHIGNSPAINRLREDIGLASVLDKNSSKETDEFHPINNSTDITQATMDEFIHSGVNLCFGILQVVLSLIPPAIGAVLSVVGFHGSREEGLRLVWKATRDRNIHGGIGLLGLLFYYDGPFQFADVDFDIPAAKTNGLAIDEMDGSTLLHPGKKLTSSLLQARALFPNSALWLLQEARMLSKVGRLQEAVELLDSIDENSIEMRQVKSLIVFEKATTLVYMHEFVRAAGLFLALMDISEWSHGLYTYIAGCCYLEMYRNFKLGIINDGKENIYKEKAIELIFSSVSLVGKKKFLSKVLPLDRFLLRKVDQFKKISAKLESKDLLDAIGTSPIHEVIYLYKGYNRMTVSQLKMSLRSLNDYHNPCIDSKYPSQEFTKNLLTSLVLRRLGKVEEGCRLLDEKVLPYILTLQGDKTKYIKRTEDPWAYPAAFYERALFSWKLKGTEGLKEAHTWLTRAQDYQDDYELSTRIGMTIKAAKDRVEESI